MHLESCLALDRHSAATSIRLLKLIAYVVDHWHSDNCLKDASALTDSELHERFVISGAVSVFLDSREQRQRDRRRCAVRFPSQDERLCWVVESQGSRLVVRCESSNSQ